MKGKRVRLGEVISEAKTVRCGESHYPVLSMTMREGLMLQSDRFKKAIASRDIREYKVVAHGQLVVSFPIDEGVLSIQNVVDVGVVSPAYAVWDIAREQVDDRYLELFLRSPYALNYYKSLMRGSTARRRTLPKPVLLSLDLPLPHLSAQRKIAEELDRICALKRAAEKVVEKLGVLAKAKFNEMFGDLAVNQHGYKIVSFDDAASIEGGLETDYEKYANYPHIGIDSIEKDTGLLVGYRTVAQDHVKSGKYHFTEKHIIYSKIRPNLNKVALPSFEGLCSADAYAVLPGKNTDRVFLAYVLRSKQFLDYIVPLSGRSGMPKANQGQVRGFRFPLPPLPLQRHFAAYVGKVEKIEAAAKKVVEKLDVLYRAKLQEYFA